MRKMLTVAEVAERLGRSIAAVRLDAKSGRFPGADKVGRDWVIPESALARFQPLARGRPRAEKRPKKDGAGA